MTKCWTALLGIAGLAIACGRDRPSPDGGNTAGAGPDAAPLFQREEVLDPAACRSCHPGQYAEWSGSMHAYAAEDPVFLAMNRRGQEETNGALGDFCVNCHAPLAVREGLTEDGLNLDEVPDAYKGVTCYFCHNLESIEGDHDNALVLANDATLLGSFSDPLDNVAHASGRSTLLDAKHADSSRACGACHDLTLPETLVGREIALERTFREWEETLFNRAHSQGGLGCVSCHMPLSVERKTSADVPGAPERPSRRHDFEAIDLALTPFPNQERQRLLTERLLDTSLLGEICVSRVGAVEVTLENAGAGHHWPTGASQDREPWLEVEAFASDDATPVFRTLEPGEAANADAGAVVAEPIVLKDFAVDANGEPAHMFWDVRAIQTSTTIPGAATRDLLDPEFHRERKSWTFETGSTAIERVTLRVRVRAVALEVLADLVNSGHLDPSIAEAMPVLDVLPDRCYDDETRERFGDVISTAECDDDPDRALTLVWHRGEAVPGERRYRESLIDQVPADCLSHPTYVPPPAP